MVITLDSELADKLIQVARQTGVSPEILALRVLREKFLTPVSLQAQDDWERELLSLATDCGISLSDGDLSRDSYYE